MHELGVKPPAAAPLACRDVTKRSEGHEGRSSCTAWTNQHLCEMADRREAIWQEEIASGRVPRWLVDWVEACRCKTAADFPDYDFFRDLLEAEAAARLEASAGAVGEPAKAAGAAAAAHLVVAEE